MHNDKLGYITASPDKLGTCLKVGVRAKLPKVSAHDKFADVSVCIAMAACL